MEALSIPLDSETRAKLVELSKQRNCSETMLAQQALREFIDLQIWQIQAIKEGIQAADRKQLVDHDDLRRQWESRLENQVD